MGPNSSVTIARRVEKWGQPAPSRWGHPTLSRPVAASTPGRRQQSDDTRGKYAFVVVAETRHYGSVDRTGVLTAYQDLSG